MQSIAQQKLEQFRPVAKGGSERSDDPPPSAKRSTFPGDCSRTKRWHYFNASFILSRVCLMQLVVGLYSLLSAVALSQPTVLKATKTSIY